MAVGSQDLSCDFITEELSLFRKQGRIWQQISQIKVLMCDFQRHFCPFECEEGSFKDSEGFVHFYTWILLCFSDCSIQCMMDTSSRLLHSCWQLSIELFYLHLALDEHIINRIVKLEGNFSSHLGKPSLWSDPSLWWGQVTSHLVVSEISETVNLVTWLWLFILYDFLVQ